MVVRYGAADGVPEIRNGMTLIHVPPNSPTRLPTLTGTAEVDLGVRVERRKSFAKEGVLCFG